MSSPSIVANRPAPLLSRAIPISWVLLLALVVHGPLLLMQFPNDSYDANFHKFFASHYAQHWFDPWNPKQFTGFSQTSYPPMEQQWVALFSHVIGLGHGIHLCPVHCHPAAADRRFPLRANMGE